MTVKKLETLADLIVEAERRYDKVAEESGFQADYALGRLRGLQYAAKCDRLTPAEQAVIEAALAMTGPALFLERFAMALGELRKEREGERKVARLDTRRTAQRIVADGIPCDAGCPYGGRGPDCTSPGCDDCGSDLHPTDSVYCPVRQQDDDGRD